MTMTILAEEDLQISLPSGYSGRKFDEETSHGLSHCMKAVDFIVETKDRTLFIEFKDPDNPCASIKDKNAFIRKFMGGAIDSDLKTKCRDSWLYEFAAGRTQKPVYYLVLIAASSLSEAELLTRTEALQRQIPIMGPNARAWENPFVTGCAVMNLATWNRLIPDIPATRKSKHH